MKMLDKHTKKIKKLFVSIQRAASYSLVFFDELLIRYLLVMIMLRCNPEELCAVTFDNIL